VPRPRRRQRDELGLDDRRGARDAAHRVVSHGDTRPRDPVDSAGAEPDRRGPERRAQPQAARSVIARPVSARPATGGGDPMAKRVCVRNAAWVVAWAASNKRHAYLEHGDVAFTAGTLDYVGRNYTGRADETIDGRGLMVMPGLIDVHSHPAL